MLYLLEDAILSGPVYMRWMYPFERYLKKLKDYVRNAAKLEGSIAESYVTDEALTFCLRYFDGVEMRFNRPDKNDDGIIQPGSYLSSNPSTSRWKNSHTWIWTLMFRTRQSFTY